MVAVSRRWSWTKPKGWQPEQQETRIQAASIKREDSTAISNAVEGNSGCSKPLEGNLAKIHMVGGTQQSKQNLEVLICAVTKDFYRKKLQSTYGRVKRLEQMLTLREANGLEIPYISYLELNSLGPMFWCRFSSSSTR